MWEAKTDDCLSVNICIFILFSLKIRLRQLSQPLLQQQPQQQQQPPLQPPPQLPQHYAGIVHQDDLGQEMRWRPVDHTVDRPEERGPGLVVEDDDDWGAGQVVGVNLHILLTPVISSVWQASV